MKYEFRFGNVRVVSALIEGTFPAMMGLVPAAFCSEIILDKAHLIKALGRVSVLASNQTMQLSVSSRILELHAKTMEVGNVHEKVPLLERDGEEYRLSLNSAFFTEILQCIHNEKVRIRYAGNRRPIVIQPYEHTETLFLMTPVLTSHSGE